MRPALVALSSAVPLVVCCSAFSADGPASGSDAGAGEGAAGDAAPSDASSVRDAGDGLDAAPLKDCVTHTLDFETTGYSSPWVGSVGLVRTTETPHAGGGAGRVNSKLPAYVQAELTDGRTHVDVDSWIRIATVAAYAEVGCLTYFHGGSSTMSLFLSYDGSAYNLVADKAGTTLKTQSFTSLTAGYVHATTRLDLIGTTLHYESTFGDVKLSGSADVGSFVAEVAGVRCGLTFADAQGSVSADIDDIRLRACRR